MDIHRTVDWHVGGEMQVDQFESRFGGAYGVDHLFTPLFSKYNFFSIIQHEMNYGFYLNWRRRLHSDFSLSMYKYISSRGSSALDMDIDQAENRYLISTSSDFNLKIFDLENEDTRPAKQQSLNQEKNDQAQEYEASNPERRKEIEMEILVNKKVATISESPIVNLRPLVVKRINQGQTKHKHTIGTIQWFPIDTGIFVTGSFDHTVRVWDTNKMESVRRCRFPEKVYKVSMSRCMAEPLICVGSGQREVSCIDIRTGNVSLQLLGHRLGTWAIDWHPFNPYIVVTGSEDGTMRLWDIRKIGMRLYFDISHTKRSKKKRDTFHRFTTENYSTKMKVPEAHAYGVTSLRFTNDGTRIISTGSDEKIRIWDANSGENLLIPFHEVQNKFQRSHRFATDPDDEYLYFPVGNEIHLYNLASGSLLKKIEGHFSTVNTCIFHPTSSELYSCAMDHQILIYSPTEIQEKRKSSHREMIPQTLNEEGNWSDDEDTW